MALQHDGFLHSGIAGIVAHMLHLGDSTLAQAVFHVPHCDMLGILVQRVSITPDELLPGCKPQPFSPSLPQLPLIFSLSPNAEAPSRRDIAPVLTLAETGVVAETERSAEAGAGAEAETACIFMLSISARSERSSHAL